MRRFAFAIGASISLLAGCTDEPETSYRDPDFKLLLILEDRPPPCDCLEPVLRFGEPIRYDDEHGIWLNDEGAEVDLSVRAKTESPYYHGDTIVRFAPDMSFGAIARAFESLGNEGICRFGRIALWGIEGFDPLLRDGYGDEVVLPTRLYSFQSTERSQLICRQDEPPEPAPPGFSRGSAMFNL